ncbi:MAG TPA: DUF4159 domain-containing protein [Chthoniobacteraceae bacterium]|jgi:hypothetical protein|nr:DUF4159 domain-containing protein [Chthoniobacteraceae bacterium]
MELIDGAPGEEPKPSWTSALLTRLAALRFLTFSALFHVVALLLIGGTVLYKNMEETPDFAPAGGLFAPESVEQSPPEQAPTLSPTSAPSVTPSASASAPSVELSAITSSSAAPAFTIAASSMPQVKTTNINTAAAPPPMAMSGSLTKAAAAGIAKFSGSWAKPMAGGKGAPLQKREFQFTAYLAKYAGGDWSSTVRMDKGAIVEGSLPNLLFVMSKLSKDKVSGDPQTKPLDLASEEIFEKKPPFIFFTGHRDFVLTDQEITNLRNYIIVGGCLWGDSSLPGQRSRFDLAFRREMRRVIPDLNKDWKELPSNHPIYTKAYFPDITMPPPGINYYHEPCYYIPGMAGEIGVLYTPNDYGDMYQFGIDEHGEIDLSRDENHQMVAVNEQMWWRHNVYFRNIEGKALLKTYKFGMNVAIHLMTRWEDKLGMAATMP